MIRFFAFLLFLSISVPGMAQFYTIRCAKSLFKVETREENRDTLSMYEKEPAEQQTPPDEERDEADIDSIRTLCMEKYRSVSLPLKSLEVSSRFGLRTDPFNAAAKTRHDGIDLIAPKGAEVHSMFAGKVIRAGQDKRSGKYVVIQHGNYTIAYCHLSRQTAQTGDLVCPGDIIGLVGSTGRSTGPHLHITAKRNGKCINPTIILNYIINVRSEALERMGRLVDKAS